VALFHFFILFLVYPSISSAQVVQSLERAPVSERPGDVLSSLRRIGPTAALPVDNSLQLMNMTGGALIAVLDCDGCLVHISHGSKTPALSIPSTSRLTLSIAPDVSLSPRAFWLPVNGIQILPPQSSSFYLTAADDGSDGAPSAAALSHIVAFPSRKESTFVVVLCSGVQIRNCLLCAIDIGYIDASGSIREVLFSFQRIRPFSYIFQQIGTCRSGQKMMLPIIGLALIMQL
jgi:hypothetical protein